MTENKIYKIVMRMKINNEKGLCAICPIHSGCNKLNKLKSIRSWKKHRQKQYKKTS